MIDVSASLRSLTKNERCERIAQVAHQKWASMSDSLRSLTKNERPWAAQVAHQKWANEQMARLFEQIAHWFIVSQETSNSL